MGKRTGLLRLNVSRWEEKRRKNLLQRQVWVGISDADRWGWEIAGQCWGSERKCKGNGEINCSHYYTDAKELENLPGRTWAVQMPVTGKGDRQKKMRHKFVAIWHNLLLILQHVQPVPILSCINHSSIRITPIICSYPICLQSLSHMFLWPMCQKSEQLPIKVLLKSSERKPDCLTWCDTIATQSPLHDLTLKVLERVSQSTTSTSGPISVGDAGTQTCKYSSEQ